MDLFLRGHKQRWAARSLIHRTPRSKTGYNLSHDARRSTPNLGHAARCWMVRREDAPKRGAILGCAPARM